MIDQIRTKVRPVSLLLQSTINALAAESVLVLSCLQEAFWNHQEEDQVVDHGLKSSSSTNIRASLEDFKYCSKPPMPLRVPETIERLAKSKIADQVKHQKVIPGHDVDRGFAPAC